MTALRLPTLAIVGLAFTLHVSSARAQNRAGDQTETFSRKVQLGAQGRVTIANVSGRITVRTVGGDQVSIDAVKRADDKASLATARIVVDSRPGRVDIRTDYSDQPFRSGRVSVDYTVLVPTMASVEARSVSGEIDVTGVKGAARAESVSGALRLEEVPRLEEAKTVSGEITISGVTEGDLNLSTVSGSLTARTIMVKSLTATTVSGRIVLNDASCERLMARSVSGRIEYEGTLVDKGRYEASAHSGSIRFTLPATVGFDLDANSFSGAIRSEFPMTVGGDDRNLLSGRGPNRSVRATFGNGSAELVLRTFSGSVDLIKR